MLPFERYPGEGRRQLGLRRGANARWEYGLQLRRKTGETTCAYCGLDLFSTYDRWLMLQVDHAVPTSVAKKLGVSFDLYEDLFNLVLACAACNGFDNRYGYVPDSAAEPEWTAEAFVSLRDKVFSERFERIAARHIIERAFFEKLPMLLASTDALLGGD